MKPRPATLRIVHSVLALALGVSTAHAVAARMDAGHVTIYGSAAFGFEVPFGGVKHSGLGREGGPEAILAYTRLKNVWVNLKQK